MAATPPATHKATITPAAPMDRRSDTPSAVSLLDIGFLPVLAIRQLPETIAKMFGTATSDTGIANTNTGYCKIPVLRAFELKDTFATLLWTVMGRGVDGQPPKQNLHRCDQMETVGAMSGRQVLQAKCCDDGDKFLCEVTFRSKGDSTERLCFDIVSVARASNGWELKSGLCKSGGAPRGWRFVDGAE